jgi:GT2 family glycosyltransferase
LRERTLAQPLVTIGLTTYNAADRVERAVNSALAQTWRPIEIVAVDDASNDGTRAILDRLAAQHPALRVFGHAANGGIAVSRNRIRRKRAVISSPSSMMMTKVFPARRGQLTRILEYERDYAGGAPSLSYRPFAGLFRKGATGRVHHGETEAGVPAGPAVAQRILLGTPLQDAYGACPTCSQMARLSTYRKLDGFDLTLRRGEDTDFSIRLPRPAATLLDSRNRS